MYRYCFLLQSAPGACEGSGSGEEVASCIPRHQGQCPGGHLESWGACQAGCVTLWYYCVHDVLAFVALPRFEARAFCVELYF